MHHYYNKMHHYNTLNHKMHNRSTDSEIGGAILIILFFLILIPMAIIQSVYAPKRRNYKSIDDAQIARNAVNNIHNNAMFITKIIFGYICIYLISSYGFDSTLMVDPVVVSIIGVLPFMFYTSFTKWRVNKYNEMIDEIKRF